MQIETPTAAVDTNEEYIIPQNAVKEPPVLKTVFKAIIVDTIKDFFGSIIGFFLLYIKHFLNAFIYFWSPSLRKRPFDKLDYKEYCKRSFELALLVLFAVIFLVKLNWIPPTDAKMLNWLNNDLSQMGIQFMMFVFFAIIYLVLVVFSIFSGRLWRSILKIKITKKESDILFIYLNNAFFSIAAVIGLVVRCMISMQTTDAESIGQGLIVIFLPLCLVLTIIWSIRFALLNKLGFLKGLLFFLFSTIFYSVGFALGQLFTVAFLMNI